MSQTFPTAIPSYPDTSGGEELGSAGGGVGLSRIIDDYGLDMTAIATKVGSGASTPTDNYVLRGNGIGTSAWEKINLATDVTGTLPVANGDTSVYEGKRYIINNPYYDGGANHLKGQMHGHSTNSDGADTASAYMTAYENAGYDFATITDHDYITDDPVVAGITWLGNSVEESTGRHIIPYDITDQTTVADVQTVINFHRDQNRIVNIPHPQWAGHYTMNESDMGSYYDFNFLEVYNRKTGEYSDTIWDYALSSGKKTFALAVDDCHGVTTAALFNKAWVVVHSDGTTASDIKASLRKGNFYASTGNDISIAVSDNVITASSTGSSNFTFYGRNGRVLKTENAVTSSVYTILGNELYVRVKSVLAADSTIAWSQPIFIDVIGDDDERISRVNTGIWQDVIPTLTNIVIGTGGRARNIFRYTQIGKTIDFEGEIILGTSGASVTGIPTITLPVTAAALVSSGGGGTQTPIGRCRMYAGASTFNGPVDITSTTQIRIMVDGVDATGAYVTTVAITSTVPDTWTAGDAIRYSGTYDAA